MAKVSVLSPGGYPKAPYGSFTGKPASGGKSGFFSVLGPGGYPRPPYGNFSGKTAGPVTTVVHDHPFLATVGRLMSIP